MKRFLLSSTRTITWVLMFLLLMITMSSAATSGIKKIEKKDVKVDTSQINPNKLVKKDVRASELDAIKRAIPLLAWADSKTELYIQRDSAEFRNYYQKFNIDWNHKDQNNIKFAWKTDETKVVSAIWQVSTIRFSGSPYLWKNEPGIVAEGTAPGFVKEGNYFTFFVDFGEFSPQHPSNITKLSTPEKSIIRTDIKPIKPIKQTTPTTKVGETKTVTPSKTIVRTDLRLSEPTVEAKNYRLKNKIDYKLPILMQIRYYVRVVTLDASGNCIGTPSPAVEIIYGELPPEQSDVNWVGDNYSPPPSNLPKINHPDIKVSHYVPIQQEAYDSIYHFVVIKDIPSPFGDDYFYKKGQKLDLTPKKDDKSWLEKIGDWFSDLISFVTDAVNWVSNAYESIKKWAVDKAVGVLGEWARGPLTMGLEIGLAAIGLPPSIPNFDQLCEMGYDYLIIEVSDYAGVSPEFTKQAVDTLMTEAKKASNGGGNPNIWLKPDPDYYYRPAYLEITATNNTSQPTARVYANIHIRVPDDQDDNLFTVPYALIPTLQPGESVSLPIFLEEYTKNRMLDTGYYDGMHRFWDHYYHYRAKVLVYSWGGSPDQYANPLELTQWFWLEKPSQEVNFAYAAPPVATPTQ